MMMKYSRERFSGLYDGALLIHSIEAEHTDIHVYVYTHSICLCLVLYMGQDICQCLFHFHLAAVGQ